MLTFKMVFVILTHGMGISDKVPGMKPGSTVRNIGVGIVYVFGIMMVFGAVADDPDDDGAEAEAEADEEELEEEQEETEEAEADEEEEIDEVDEEETAEEADVEEPDVDEAPEEAETDEEAPEADEEDEEITDEEAVQLFELTVAELGVDADAEIDDGVLEVEYISTAQTQNEIAGEIGTITGAYLGLAEQGYDGTDRMEVTILNPAGETAGTYHVEFEWVEAHANDEMTEEELFDLILGTLEVEEDQAAVEASATGAIA
jgi:hypothetical protein